MIKISLKQLASEVATLLGESLAPECQPEESPFPDLEERVRILAPVVLEVLICKSSVEMLSGWAKLEGPVIHDSEGRATLHLPDDFLRLVALKMSDWSLPVTKITSEGDPNYPFTGSRWESIRGSRERPVVTLQLTPSGGKCLKLYGCTEDSTPEYGWYMKRCVSAGDSLEIPKGLYGELLERLKSDALVHFA